MYVPASFRVDDPAGLADFIRRYSFATFITQDGSAPFASHLPMLFRPDAGEHGTLIAHMARANPQWQHFASGAEALAVFHGPHSYVSPSWYETRPAVPTWNYAAVHAYGVPRLVTDHARVVEHLNAAVSRFEASLEHPWSGELPEKFRDSLISSIVAFEVPVTRIEGKFKLGQNRSDEDVRSVVAELARSAHAGSRELADFMQSELALEQNPQG